MSVLVRILWDAEAAVWVAESDDVPGLALECGSFDALIERLRYAIPELMELNGQKPQSLQLRFVTERLDQIAV